MSRRFSFGVFVTTVLVMVSVGIVPAFADHSVRGSSNGNDLRSSITKSGNNFACTGTNTVPGSWTVGVMTVCQYKSGGTWHDMGNVSGNDSLNDTVTATYNDNPCTGNDGGANLADGLYPVRARADGYWTTAIGQFNFYSGSLHTTSPFYSANC
jgi:hypothetical protein